VVVFLTAWGLVDRFYNERIAVLKERIAGYESKLQVGSPDEAARKLAELEKRVSASLPRSLSDAQRQSISGALSKQAAGEQQIHIIAQAGGCSDCGEFASDFAAAFQQAGWRVPTIALDFGAYLSEVRSGGVAIAVVDRKTPPALESVLANALTAAG